MNPQLALASLRYAVNATAFVRGEPPWAEWSLEEPVHAAALCLAIDERLRASNAFGVLHPLEERFGSDALGAAFTRLGLPDHARLALALCHPEGLDSATDGNGVLVELHAAGLRIDIPAVLGFRDDAEGALRWYWCEQSPSALYTAALRVLEHALGSASGRDRLAALLADADLGKLLHQAIDHGDAERVAVLLTAGADPNVGRDDGDTPLGFAVYVMRSHDGPLDLARHLLEAGAKPDQGANAELLAKAVPDPELFDLLLDHGWDPAHVGSNGSALEEALDRLKKLRKPEPRYGADERDITAGRHALGRLLEAGAIARLPADHLVRLVATAPTPELGEHLVAAGAPREAREGDRGWNVLHVLAARGRAAALEKALSRGLDYDLRLPRTFAINDWTALRAGTTPLDAVEVCGREKAAAEVRALLQAAGASQGAPSFPAVRIVSTEGAEPDAFGRYGTLARRLADFLPKEVAASPGLSGLAFYHDVHEAVEEGRAFLLAEGSRVEDVEALVNSLCRLGLVAEVVPA